MKHLLFVLLVSLLSHLAVAQYTAPLAIQRVELQDSVVIREIRRLITDETDSVGLVKQGMGYVELGINEYYDVKSPFLRIYAFYISFMVPTSDWSDNAYPPFYTYVGGRLVLVHVNELGKSVKLTYSAKSKKQLLKRIDQFLEKPRRVRLPGFDNGKDVVDKHYRLSYIRFDSGRNVYIRRDGSVLVRPANDFSPVK